MSTKRVWHSTYWTGLKADTNGNVEPGYNSGAMQSLEGRVVQINIGKVQLCCTFSMFRGVSERLCPKLIDLWG